MFIATSRTESANNFSPTATPWKPILNKKFRLEKTSQINRACPKTPVLERNTSNSRLVPLEKCEFIPVNDHFESKRNAEVELYR